MALFTESMLRVKLKKGISNPFVLNEGDKITPAAIDFLRDRKIEIDRKQTSFLHKQTERSETHYLIPVGISNRHVHLSNEHVKALFGENYELSFFRPLSQPGQFAAKEQVTLLGPKGFIQHVRILGPEREETQVEISKTDGFQLGIHPPVRLSGFTEDTPGITLIGPNGCVTLQRGVIVAKCHIHMSPADAEKFKVSDGDRLILRANGERPVIFPDVDVRVNEHFKLDFHVDLDEGNAAGLKNGELISLVGVNGEFFE